MDYMSKDISELLMLAIREPGDVLAYNAEAQRWECKLHYHAPTGEMEWIQGDGETPQQALAEGLRLRDMMKEQVAEEEAATPGSLAMRQAVEKAVRAISPAWAESKAKCEGSLLRFTLRTDDGTVAQEQFNLAMARRGEINIWLHNQATLYLERRYRHSDAPDKPYAWRLRIIVDAHYAWESEP